jgi:aspartate racemase
VPGELHIGGAGLARGYLNRPDLTAEKFIPHPFNSNPGECLYKTGDLVRYLPDGNIEFIGRLDNQVKIRGFRVELGEIEGVLGSHPAVRETMVTAWDASPGDKRFAAYVVPEQRSSPTPGELQSFLGDKLPYYMVPSSFIFLDRLPLSANGKLDRGALPSPEGNGAALEDTFVAPRSPIEEALTGIWTELLRLERVGVNDNFFRLGGHSLLAVRLFAEIEKRFKKRLPLSSLFERPTIQNLASMLSQTRSPNASSSLVAIQPHGSKPPFFCIHEFFGDVLCYMNLARHLGQDQPFYALRARGLDDEEEPFADIVAMASHYIDTIRAVQPKGPYAVGGLCLGGVVAFEMAQQLCSQGEPVSLVALLDSGINSGDDGTSPLWYRIETFAKGLPRWLIGALQLNRSQWLDLIKLKQAIFRSKVGSQNGSSQRSMLIEEMADLFRFSENHRKVARAQQQAIRNYRPKVYPLRLTLFRASMQPLFSSHKPDKGWGRLAGGGLDVRVIPANHLGMLQEPHVRILAKELKACLDRKHLQVNAAA